MSQGNAVKCLLFLLASIITSCASLSKSQLNEVNAFGLLTCNFSAYPGTVVSTYNRIHQQQELYRANSIDDAAEHFKAIEKANDFKQKTDLISPKIDLSLKIIDQYAQGLIILTANKYNKKLDTSAKSFGSNLDKLVAAYNKVDAGANLPSGIGSLAAAAITLGGDIYIRKKQADDIKQILPIGDKIIEKMTTNILEFLGSPSLRNGNSLEGLIKAEKSTISTNYQSFVSHKKIVTLDDERGCLQMLEDLDDVERLRLQCIEAVSNLRKAHAQLLKDMDQKQTLMQYATELQSYGDDVKAIYNTIQAIK